MRVLNPRSKMRIITQNSSLSPPFNSRSPRYRTQNNQSQSPGPCTYTIPSQDQEKTSKYHIQLKKSSAVKKQFEWIFSTTRSKNLYSSNKNPKLGPGCYTLKDSSPSQSLTWNKCQRFSNQSATNQSIIGPGSYDTRSNIISEHFKKGQQAMFKSKTPKISLFRQTKSIQESTLSPVAEDQEQNTKKKMKQKDNSIFFASKVPRFLTQNSNNKLGPGSYEISSKRSSKHRTGTKLMHIFHNMKPEILMPKSKEQRIKSQVGPGSYNVKKFDMSYDLEYKGQPFPKEARFNLQSIKKQRSLAQSPGPGEYMQQKFIYSKPEEVINSTKFKKVQQSKILQPVRQFFRREQNEEQKDIGPGQYETNQNSIDYRLKKKIHHQKKLRVMQISLPGFSSNVPRFK